MRVINKGDLEIKSVFFLFFFLTLFPSGFLHAITYLFFYFNFFLTLRLSLFIFCDFILWESDHLGIWGLCVVADCTTFE